VLRALLTDPSEDTEDEEDTGTEVHTQ